MNKERTRINDTKEYQSIEYTINQYKKSKEFNERLLTKFDWYVN